MGCSGLPPGTGIRIAPAVLDLRADVCPGLQDTEGSWLPLSAMASKVNLACISSGATTMGQGPSVRGQDAGTVSFHPGEAGHGHGLGELLPAGGKSRQDFKLFLLSHGMETRLLNPRRG